MKVVKDKFKSETTSSGSATMHHPAANGAALMFVTLLGLIALYLYGAQVSSVLVRNNTIDSTQNFITSQNLGSAARALPNETNNNEQNLESPGLVETTEFEIVFPNNNSVNNDQNALAQPTQQQVTQPVVAPEPSSVIFFDNQPLD